VEDSPKQLLQVVNASKDGKIIAHKVAWAGSSAERRRGLLGRISLNAEEGIYIAPSEWVHTFGMRFPIDIAFLSSRGQILAVHHRLKPNRFSKFVLRAKGVLELSEGALRLTNTEIGDVVQFVNIATRELITF
jgi:hypothetical protein